MNQINKNLTKNISFAKDKLDCDNTLKISGITILNEEEYRKYYDLIPFDKINKSLDMKNIAPYYHSYIIWWLKDQSSRHINNSKFPEYKKFVKCIYTDKSVRYEYCDINGGIVPVIIFTSKYSNFYFKGNQINIGKYTWTVLDNKDDQIYAICNSSVKISKFDDITGDWEKSKLKQWLENEFLSKIKSNI